MGRSELLAIQTLQEGHGDGALGAAWSAFLARSPSGCLFHELGFLAYHPTERFRFRHLLVERGGIVLALLPGGLTERRGRPAFRSPLGASFGGPVLPRGIHASDILAVLTTLKDHAHREGWSEIELVPPPLIFRSDDSDALGYCLHAAGFALASRLLCHALPLDSAAGEEGFAGLFRGKNPRRARAAIRAGVTTAVGGVELLDRFSIVFDETYARHGVPATHSLAEMRDLCARLPDRFRFAVASLADVPLGGIFLMRMSPRVANAFYICNSSRNPDANASLAMFAHSIETLAREGYELLDLGPSSGENGEIGAGVAYFKESLGAVAYCRDRWVWNAAAS